MRADVCVRLGKLGGKGSAPALATQLLRALGPSGAGLSVPAGEPAAAAQLLATAAAALAWARYGRLPGGDEPLAHPLEPLLAGLQVPYPCSQAEPCTASPMVFGKGACHGLEKSESVTGSQILWWVAHDFSL